MAINNGGAAFPSAIAIAPDGDVRGSGYFDYGMSLRDWFAGKALAGMHARDSYDDGQATPEKRATLAYIDADAMLKAREAK